MTEHCQTCRFWKPMDEATEEAKACAQRGEPVDLEDMPGQCRRFPPVLDPTWDSERVDGGPESFSNWWVHPVTTGEIWCGEYRA